MGASQGYGKVVNTTPEYVQKSDCSEVVKIFKNSVDNKFYYKNHLDVILPLCPDSAWEINNVNYSVKVINDSTTEAAGDYSTAEGKDTLAYGSASHVEGQFSSAIGISSHAEGQATTAVGNCSHTEGFNTYTTKNFSHAGGFYSKANYIGEWCRSGVSVGQHGMFSVGKTTYNAASTKLSFEDVATRIVLEDNTVYKLRISVIGICDSSSPNAGDIVSYEGQGLVKCVGNVVSFITPVVFNQVAETSMIGTSCNITYAANYYEINVVGLDLSTISWFAKIDYSRSLTS